MFDTWGRARFPNIRKNRERFVRLIKECADWPDCKRVSLPQLSLSISIRATGDSQLSREVETRLQSWQYGCIYRLNEVDPEIDEVISLTRNEDEQRLVRNVEHTILLYTYRNHLVHEFREPGYGMEISNNNVSPYYHGMSNLKGSNSWELVYPIGFFMNTARSILGNLKRYLQSDNLDPYSFYEFGTIWRPS